MDTMQVAKEQWAELVREDECKFVHTIKSQLARISALEKELEVAKRAFAELEYVERKMPKLW